MIFHFLPFSSFYSPHINPMWSNIILFPNLCRNTVSSKWEMIVFINGQSTIYFEAEKNTFFLNIYFCILEKVRENKTEEILINKLGTVATAKHEDNP
jgi:hypothetical protein